MQSSALRKFPAARGLTPWRAVLEPGGVLFVPAETPHFVRNLPADAESSTPTVALSTNYADLSNLECAINGLDDMGIRDAPAKEAAAALRTLKHWAD